MPILTWHSFGILKSHNIPRQLDSVENESKKINTTAQKTIFYIFLKTIQLKTLIEKHGTKSYSLLVRLDVC